MTNANMVVTQPGKERNRMQSTAYWNVIRQQRHVVNIVLACVAVALEVYYSICGGSCSYLRGDLIGIPLQYIGIAYMALIIFLSIIKADRLLVMLISAGVGIEFYLIGFQIWYHTYCPYCLAFGGIIFVLLILNFSLAKKWLSIVFMVLALLLFSLFFEGSVTPSYAEDFAIPTFGQGKVSVRIYTDYFCPPCRAMEPDVEPILAELIKQKKINVTFIDTPYYQHSSLYAKYYLYTMNEKREFEHALKTRGTLIESAKQNIAEPARIEAILSEKGIRFKSFDTKPVFDVYAKSLKDDGINATPTCVIEQDGKKEKVTGKGDIINALKALR
jgi:thiol-disulfide isomerase/thioredoxin